MFFKHKKVGDVYDIRKFHAHKKVIDWEAVGGLVFWVILGLCLIGWLTN